jgi:hypothetical protein
VGLGWLELGSFALREEIGKKLNILKAKSIETFRLQHRVRWRLRPDHTVSFAAETRRQRGLSPDLSRLFDKRRDGSAGFSFDGIKGWAGPRPVGVSDSQPLPQPMIRAAARFPQGRRLARIRFRLRV